VENYIQTQKGSTTHALTTRLKSSPACNASTLAQNNIIHRRTVGPRGNNAARPLVTRRPAVLPKTNGLTTRINTPSTFIYHGFYLRFFPLFSPFVFFAVAISLFFLVAGRLPVICRFFFFGLRAGLRCLALSLSVRCSCFFVPLPGLSNVMRRGEREGKRGGAGGEQEQGGGQENRRPGTIAASPARPPCNGVHTVKQEV